MTNSLDTVPHFKINTHIQIQGVWYSAQRHAKQEYLKWDAIICNDGHDPYENQAEWNSWWKVDEMMADDIKYSLRQFSYIWNEDDWET